MKRYESAKARRGLGLYEGAGRVLVLGVVLGLQALWPIGKAGAQSAATNVAPPSPPPPPQTTTPPVNAVGMPNQRSPFVRPPPGQQAPSSAQSQSQATGR